MSMYGLITFASALLLMMGLYFGLTFPLWLAWLLAVNVVTLATYGYDKRIAGSGKSRVSELLLLGLALVGGSPGAWLGMHWFRHKTVKTSFQRKFWLVVGLQVVLLIRL